MAVPVAELPTQELLFASATRRRGRIRNLDVWVPACALVMIVLACFLGPWLFHIQGPNAGSLTQAFDRPGTPGHILGTDALGNDILSRCLFGGRISLEVGFSCIMLGLIVGGTLGVLSGYMGGTVESVIMRLLDMLLAFPSLILILCVSAYLGPSEGNLILALAFFSVPANARVIRAATLRIRSQDYVTAARIGGHTSRTIMLKHVLPNVLPPLLTFSLLGVAVIMLVEASLSFLGLGIPPPQPSWGNMIAQGQEYLEVDPGLVVIPAIFLFVTILSLNVLGDALRARWSQT